MVVGRVRIVLAASCTPGRGMVKKLALRAVHGHYLNKLVLISSLALKEFSTALQALMKMVGSRSRQGRC
jgi:hypothetical protein